MRVLGLDPGLRHTGWGVIDVAGNRLPMSPTASCMRRPTCRWPSGWCSCSGAREVLARFRPDEAAVEETFVNKNPTSTLKLGVARGVVLLVPALARPPGRRISRPT